VLWNEEAGVWLDYDIINQKPRPYFVPTNLSPLWMKCYDPAKRQNIADRVVKYVNDTKLDDYPGGVPTTLSHTGKMID
jgi:alpha,alpha-trehalase